jgi:signal transduction histidine kinase
VWAVATPSDTPTDLVRPLWRALAVFRVLTLVFACVGVYTRWDDLVRPWGAVALMSLMAVWTAVVTFGYSRYWGGDNTCLAVCDLAVTIGCMAGTLLAQPLSHLQNGASLLTSVWAAGPALALAIARGRDGGLLGAVAISGATLLLRGSDDLARQLYNIQLLLVAGLVVGYAATTTRRASARLTDAIAAESAAAERLRLSRTIHDGVLQVLAQVQRSGRGSGGDRDAARLADLAAEQEVALRALITSSPATTSDTGESDLGAALAVLATTRVDVVLPARPVPLPAATVAELTAAVTEALANVTRHAGPDARAWVVLEDLGDEVLVAVRDDGVGTTTDRLDGAAADGRLGVSQSIRGRIADLGGDVAVRTAPGEGTEWELKVSRR